MKNAHITVSTYGNGLAVGLQGTREEIEYTFNRFFNWGATGLGGMGEYLHDLSESFAYFLASEESMIRAMSFENMARWQDTPISEQYKARPRHHKKPNGIQFRHDAEAAARAEFNSFERENFMQYEKTPSHIYNESDGGAPSWVAETED